MVTGNLNLIKKGAGRPTKLPGAPKSPYFRWDKHSALLTALKALIEKGYSLDDIVANEENLKRYLTEQYLQKFIT